ncbi:hypothetical protein Ndes2437A_g03287 [Nannochloris sp. 'desiccata']
MARGWSKTNLEPWVLNIINIIESVSKSGNKKTNIRSLKADGVDGGTTVVDGVRRSTRAPKTSSKYDIAEVMASPAPRNTPKKKATPATKEAITVSPKKRGRPAKSPAPAAAAAATESQPSTPRRRGRPRKSQ